MRDLTTGEKIREAELYEEMKDFSKLKKIVDIKKGVFKQRTFKLRKLVLENLKELTKMQLKALDEEYQLIGLDKECWTDEEHFLHDLGGKIKEVEKRGLRYKDNIIKGIFVVGKKEEKRVELLLSLVEEYILLLYDELKKIDLENLLEIKSLFLSEEGKIKEIGKIISLEKRKKTQKR